MPLAATRRPPSPIEALADRRPRLAVLVSDHGWTARAIETALVTEGYATLRAGSAEEGVTLCAVADPDLVFVDRRLPAAADARGRGGRASPAAEAGGLALCRRLRRDGAISDATAVVIVTADAPRRSDLLDALAAGAWDLCAVPGDSVALLARCAAWVRAKRHADRVGELGLCDPETGLYNLRGLVRRARELAGATVRGVVDVPLACVAFRAEPGPDEPADLARRVGDACRELGRAGDAYARTGRLDFAVLAPATTDAGARSLVGRLRRALAHGAPGGREMPPSGVALRAVVHLADASGGLDDRDAAAGLVLGAVSALSGGRGD